MKLESWAIALLLILGGVIVSYHAGINVGSALAGSVHGFERMLGRPL